MEQRITRVEYYHASVADQPGEAYKFLSQLAVVGINLLAFTAVPVGPTVTQLTIFPDDPAQLKHEAAKIGLSLDGPHKAFLVQGDDELGALARIHHKIYEADAISLLKVVSRVDDKFNSTMLVGHNPGMTYFANMLASARIDNIPTCGIICTELDISSWQEILENCGTFKFFKFPKNL